MKKIFLLLIAALMYSAAAAAPVPQLSMPQHLYVAGQNGKDVVVYNCVKREMKVVHGYLRDIGVDSSGNVYVLVCSSESGWGSYYVYKNCNPQIYLSLVEDQGGIYSSAAMRVKGNDVVVAAVQSLGFNDKGYQSRMMGYVNGQRKFITGYDRKSLKYDNFKGYVKIVNNQFRGYGQENNSGNPQGDHLSCVYHVADVEYCEGRIYTTGWGEREYSEYIGATKYYLVRRCPRVWVNGAEVAAQCENSTGAAWNINILISNDYCINTSGHKGSVAYAWKSVHYVYSNDYSQYPGVLDEADFIYNKPAKSPSQYCRVFLCSRSVNLSKLDIVGMESYKKLGSTSLEIKADVSDLVSVKGGFYFIQTDKNNTREVHARKKCSGARWDFAFSDWGLVCTLPSHLKMTNPKIAVCE